MNHRYCLWRAMFLAAAGWGMLAAGRADAELLDLTAAVQSSVVQVGDPGGASDSAEQEFPATTSELPMVARAALQQGQADGQVVAAAKANSWFNDPRVGRQVQPRDFGIDAAAFADGDVVYEVSARSSEVRRIVFGSGELGLADGAEGSFRGGLLVRGILTMWSESAQADLSGAVVELRLTVNQVDGATDAARAGDELLATAVRLVGRPEGSVCLEADGVLARTPLVWTDISDQSERFGRVVVLIIPQLWLAYSYSAVIGQEFGLAASVQVALRNAGAGTGAAAVIGLPSQALPEVVDAVAGEPAGQDLAETLEAAEALGQFGVPGWWVIEQEGSPATIGCAGSACGLLGAEALLGPFGLMGLMMIGGSWVGGRRASAL